MTMNSGARLRAATLAAAIAACAPSAWGFSGAQGNIAVSADGRLAERVKSALRADPYVYDRHIDVSVQDGNVVLSGFVLGDWDLLHAVRIASNAAKPHRVIDELDIEEGGRR
jgi:osmotically-inducible protein OsmY